MNPLLDFSLTYFVAACQPLAADVAATTGRTGAEESWVMDQAMAGPSDPSAYRSYNNDHWMNPALKPSAYRMN